MRRVCHLIVPVVLLALPLFAQERRLWVLREPGEMVEYDLTTFAVKNRVKVPPQALKSPANVSVNRLGQILVVPSTTPAVTEEDAAAPHTVWLWSGQAATTLEPGTEHNSEQRGSNQVVTESAPVAALSADGTHLYWFDNHERRLDREEINLSTTITWQAWRTDLNGKNREDLASVKLPECACATGVCDETCPVGAFWAPDEGVDKFFLMTQYIAGQTERTYKTTTLYQEESGKWTGKPLPQALEQPLDASPSGNVILTSIPDAACCGWSNQSNDQTLVLANGKFQTIFDETATYKNSDYDVSFFTSNAKLSPDLKSVAMTISATAQANKPIQLAEDGQANPEESLRIRKTLAELPAVAVKTVAESTKQVAFVPHSSLVGWINDKELLILEDHLLVVYNVGSGVRRKSTVKVEDPGRVFLR
jgi:WD40 repeat protein